MNIRENVPIAELTTMRIGGKARYVVEVTELAEVPEAFTFAREKRLPVWMMGDGANTIGRDEGFDGVIILNKLRGIDVVSQTADEVTICAMGGESWDDLVAYTCERGYSGIEALSKIPGSVGAAPVQNIGAYGQEISQVIESVEVYDTWADDLKIIGKEEMQMRYRSTIFNTGPEAGRYFIISVTLLLENEMSMAQPFYNSLQKYLDEHGITEYTPATIREAVSAVRAAKLPDPEVEPSAGSFFKNIYLSGAEAEEVRAQGIKNWEKARGIRIYEKPDGQLMINSGYLIEKAGLKGREFHGFYVSDKAALILINKNAGGNFVAGAGKNSGKASSYADLAAARKEICDIVREKFGYELEQEPVEIVAGASDDARNATGGARGASGGDAKGAA